LYDIDVHQPNKYAIFAGGITTISNKK
jgi:hypothetical protein